MRLPGRMPLRLGLRSAATLLATGLAAAAPAAQAAERVVIGVATDGPAKREVLTFEAMRAEITPLLGTEFDVTFPESAQRQGDWTLEGAQRAVDELLRDPSVDVVLAAGLLTSQAAARVEAPRKPLIATLVADAQLQGFPLAGDSSGRRNFTYITSFRGVDEEIAAFRDVTGFEHLAILVDQAILAAIPELSTKADELARNLGSRVSLVTFDSTVDALLAAIPADADAVYLAPLRRLDSAALERLAEGLIERRLPSLSAAGRREVLLGILMAVGGLPTENTRFARRIALNVQSVLIGEDAGDLPVSFGTSKRYVFNMQTARAIGFLPRWAILVDAERLYDEEFAGGPSLGLRAAMLEAVEANPSLAALRLDIELAATDTDTARSRLLPALDLSASGSRIDADRASPLGQAEESVDAQVSGRQVVYSEQARAGWRVAQFLEAASDREVRTAVLDTLSDAATAYLSKLRALALEGVRQANLEVTRANLDLARLREKVGASGRSDVLRWESQIANDRRSLLEAEADRRQAGVQLNRILHRDQAAPVEVNEDDLGPAMAVLVDPRFDAFVGNPAVWDTFQAFSVHQALENAPELERLDALIDAQNRQLTAARRAYYVPELALVASSGRVLSESGAGSEGGIPGLTTPDDESWSLGVQASLPIFSGGALRADRVRADFTLRQLRLNRRAAEDDVEARVRTALHAIASSFPGIELSDAAADAAASNLELVTDAYSQGAVSITDLIDAQNAALSADLAAAEARYTFLIDYVAVLRGTADFSLLLGAESADAWYARLEAWFEAAGVEPLRR